MKKKSKPNTNKEKKQDHETENCIKIVMSPSCDRKSQIDFRFSNNKSQHEQIIADIKLL